MTRKHTARVPFAGWVDVEFEFDGDPKTSTGWGEATEWEYAALEAAWKITLGIEGEPEPPEWNYEYLVKITSGNALHVDQNGIEPLDEENDQ